MIIRTSQDRHTARRTFLVRLFVSLRAPFDDREDLAQQSLLRFLSRGYAEKDLDEKSENALLARIGYNTFIDTCRKKRSLCLGVRDGQLVDQSEDQRQQLLIAEIRDLVARSNLTRDQLVLIETKYGDGKSLATISRESGLHVNTIRRRLAKILETLRLQSMKQDATAHLGRADQR
ncbi:MAG: RNA polymerase sigma factor (sigma-70 family) [Planctomycetota bacterium]|jgi:RNA polymerase sigma factor (sigma-70 family)